MNGVLSAHNDNAVEYREIHPRGLLFTLRVGLEKDQ